MVQMLMLLDGQLGALEVHYPSIFVISLVSLGIKLVMIQKFDSRKMRGSMISLFMFNSQIFYGVVMGGDFNVSSVLSSSFSMSWNLNLCCNLLDHEIEEQTHLMLIFFFFFFIDKENKIKREEENQSSIL